MNHMWLSLMDCDVVFKGDGQSADRLSSQSVFFFLKIKCLDVLQYSFHLLINKRDTRREF